MLSWEALLPRSYPHRVLCAVAGDREFWLYAPSGRRRCWRLLEFRGGTYFGASEHPSRVDAQRAAECLGSVER